MQITLAGNWQLWLTSSRGRFSGGSFGTTFIHQKTGRDVQMGGIIGFLVGAVGQIFLLVLLWVWLYYGSSPYGRVGRMYGPSRKVWYRWWE